MSELLTQEVGSLAKPNWRVAVQNDQPIEIQHVYDAQHWAPRTGVDEEYAANLLWSAQDNFGGRAFYTQKEKAAVRTLAARMALGLQEAAGLDIVYDGEQDRSEMYQHAVQRTGGFVDRGLVRAFDNRWYRKYAVTDEPQLEAPWHTEEVDRLRSFTDKQIKVPITGAYTLAAWSYDEFYGNRSALAKHLASNIIRPNIESLLEQGVDWIQIDEPAATTVPSEVPLFVETFNRSVEGLVGKFSVHICFSDYSQLFPHVAELENCSQFSLEFANRDSHELGTDAAQRPAYEILDQLKTHNPDAGVGLGVVSIHEDEIEPVELVRDRILRAVDILGDPAKVFPSPDCGLRTRRWKVAYDKLARTVEGTQLAKEKLTI